MKLVIGAAVALFFAVGAVQAQNWPAKPVTIIVKAGILPE